MTKQLELQLNKKLLIIETELEFEPREGVEYYVPDDAEELFILPKGTFKLICEGPELSEEVAEDLVKVEEDGFECWDYKNNRWGSFGFSPLESFISAIEAKGYYWGKNPLADEIIAPDINEWQDAESKTFNPEKTLIFEIFP